MLLLFDQLKLLSKSDKIGDKHSTCLGLDPEDDLVSSSVAVGVLNRGLGFAHPSQTTDRLRQGQRCSLVCVKLVMQAQEKRFTTGEEGIA